MRSRRLMNQINVVPYIDVMLVLLVIFMVTAPMIQMGSVELPSVADVPQPSSEAIYVLVEKDGQLALKETATATAVSMTQTELQRALQQILLTKPEQSVVVAADKRVTYEQVMDTLNELRQAGFKKVGLQTESSHSGS
jgi:biopolymer transport protein TolR